MSEADEQAALDQYDRTLTDQSFEDLPDFIITEHDKNTPIFKRLRKHYISVLRHLRAENDNTSLNPIDTAKIRGKIAAVKEFLEIGGLPVSENDPDSHDLGY